MILEQEEKNLLKTQEKLLEHRETAKSFNDQHDDIAIEKVVNALAYRDHLSKVRLAHDEVLEAQIRSIEAESDLASLMELNSSIVQQRDEELQKVRDIDEEAKKVKAIALKALKVCKSLLADPENEPYTEELAQQADEVTVESLETEIAAEESKLEFLVSDNPNAIEQFEARREKVQELRNMMEESDKKLEKIRQKISMVRSKWEPAVDKLVETISNAFSFNFEQIGCAGEVSIQKADDFDSWAIQVKVKFRQVRSSSKCLAINFNISRSRSLIRPLERVKLYKFWINIVSQVVNAPFPLYSTLWPCSLWPHRHFVWLMK